MFGYTCQECGQGTVREERISNYDTKIQGYRFSVPEAVVGICDKCKTEHFDSKETKRWEKLFSQSLEDERLFLLPKDIGDTRKALGLSMENFALLIGSTRQSLHNWENGKRARAQSRTADLLIKLVDKSRTEKGIDVLGFLVEEARRLGVVIKIPSYVPAPHFTESIVLKVKQITEGLMETLIPNRLSLAAEQETGKKVYVVETPDGKTLGNINYDYETAALVLEITQKEQDLGAYLFEVAMNDGSLIKSEIPEIVGESIILLKESKYFPKDIEEIRLKPKFSSKSV